MCHPTTHTTFAEISNDMHTVRCTGPCARDFRGDLKEGEPLTLFGGWSDLHASQDVWVGVTEHLP
jgi:hypothetical protein